MLTNWIDKWIWLGSQCYKIILLDLIIDFNLLDYNLAHAFLLALALPYCEDEIDSLDFSVDFYYIRKMTTFLEMIQHSKCEHEKEKRVLILILFTNQLSQFALVWLMWSHKLVERKRISKLWWSTVSDIPHNVISDLWYNKNITYGSIKPKKKKKKHRLMIPTWIQV